MTRENKVKIFIFSFFFINISFLLFVERPISADTAIDSQNSVANAYINVTAPTTNTCLLLLQILILALKQQALQ